MAIVFKALEKSSALMILFAGLLLCGSSFAGGKAEKTQGGIILVLKGSHYEMGFQHGSLLAKEVKENIKAYLYDFAFDAAKHKREELRKIYETQEPFIPAYIKEEMKGLAEGSGASLEDVQLVHILPTIYHCSGAAVFGKAVKDKKLYHFRSLDYAINIGKEKKVQENAAVIVYQPDDGIAHAVVGWAGVLGAVSGMNAEGISIGEMGSSSKEDGFNGEPMWFVVRDALKNSRTLDDALNIMKKAKWD
ncbi:MAG: hypothetical protein FJ088_16185, partial [Deltaproteobacteria bacterium]|nr:hypothetical protein [Deltaproteobacteria bacterium]